MTGEPALADRSGDGFSRTAVEAARSLDRPVWPRRSRMLDRVAIVAQSPAAPHTAPQHQEGDVKQGCRDNAELRRGKATRMRREARGQWGTARHCGVMCSECV